MEFSFRFMEMGNPEMLTCVRNTIADWPVMSALMISWNVRKATVRYSVIFLCVGRTVALTEILRCE
jgi:hypothetical protein